MFPDNLFHCELIQMLGKYSLLLMFVISDLLSSVLVIVNVRGNDSSPVAMTLK